MYCGSIAIARASPTRFLMPPESDPGFMASTPLSPTHSRRSATRRRTSADFMRMCSTSVKPTFSPTVIESNSAAPWNSSPKRLRISFRSRSFKPTMFVPSTSIEPASGVMSPMMCLRSTLLPVPLRPITTMLSPVSTSRSTPSSTCFAPSRFLSPRIRIIARR